ncbi:MAG: arylamine N-acetyltransferase family protein [Burkholderiaceae bacterium]
MTMSHPAADPLADLDAYFRRIDYTGPTAPTLETLARLVDRHAHSIPFENVDVLARRVPELATAALEDKLVRRRRGGYCFEQNHLMLAVLRRLGFDARGQEARVRVGVPAERESARTHMTLRVTLAGEDWHVDVGFGSTAPAAPLRLGDRGEQAAGTGRFRFVDVETGLMMQSLSHEGWGDACLILPSRPAAIDYKAANWFVATHPESFLGANLLVGRAVDGGRWTLFNRELSLRQPMTAAPQLRTLATRAEFEDALARHFDLRLEPADLDAVLAAIERLPEKPAA